MSKAYDEVKYGYIALPGNLIINVLNIDAAFKVTPGTIIRIDGEPASVNPEDEIYIVRFNNSEKDLYISKYQFENLKECLLNRYAIGDPENVDYSDEEENPSYINTLCYAGAPGSNYIMGGSMSGVKKELTEEDFHSYKTENGFPEGGRDGYNSGDEECKDIYTIGNILDQSRQKEIQLCAYQYFLLCKNDCTCSIDEMIVALKQIKKDRNL